MDESLHERILILAPTGRDTELSLAALGEEGMTGVACRSAVELCAKLAEGAGAVILTEEALVPGTMEALAQQLTSQPPWSDVPLLIFASQSAFDLTISRSYRQLRQTANVTIVERPVRVRTMISAVHSALRARRRQYQVRDLLAELQRRVEERDQFLAMLSHELRNPLTAISLAADNLEESPKTNDREIIIRQTRHLTKLVDDLLDIGRITSGKITLHRSIIDLCDLVEHCVETMRPRAESRRLTMVMNRLAPHAFISGDPVRLEQIVTNVLSNAIKYTSSGGRIDVTVGSEGGEAILRVRDTGRGIPEEILPHVFDLFTQGDVSIDRGEGGMGIGLTLVKRLVNLHGGTVQASSDGPGRGSEFVVALPVTSMEPAASPVEPEADAPPGHRRDIVVVEDNQDIRDLLRFKLEHLGHGVEVAEDGRSGLDVILEKRPQVALVDIGLPGVDGYELARKVREKLGSSVYLIALTGYGQAEDKKKALEAGFDLHLTKPADFVHLQKVIGRSPIASGRAVS